MTDRDNAWEITAILYLPFLESEIQIQKYKFSKSLKWLQYLIFFFTYYFQSELKKLQTLDGVGVLVKILKSNLQVKK